MAESGNAISEAIDTVKAYAKQETIDPLKHLSTFFKWGVIGAVLVLFGSILLVLGLLRWLQDVWPAHDWLTYLLAWFGAVGLTGLTALVIFRGGES